MRQPDRYDMTESLKQKYSKISLFKKLTRTYQILHFSTVIEYIHQTLNKVKMIKNIVPIHGTLIVVYITSRHMRSAKLNGITN